MTPPPVELKFVTDTHPLVWHLMESPHLSTEARRRFQMAERGEALIFLSAMTVVEMWYLHEKNRVSSHFWDLFCRSVRSEPDDNFQIVDVTYELAMKVPNVPREIVPELPDRIIAATAHSLGLPLITKDHRIQQWEGIVTIW